jgi:CBS domain-containing protein
MESPGGEQLLRASLFFDLRPVAGDLGPGRRLWEWVCDRAVSQRLFLSHMAKDALDRHVPLGFFGGFVVERSGVHRDTLDIKARGVLPITQAVRVHALSLGLRETNTVDRLVAAAERGMFSAEEVEDLREAWEVMSRLRIAHQLACLDAGQPPDNFIDPKALRSNERLLLKQAFKALARLQRVMEDRFRTEILA